MKKKMKIPLNEDDLDYFVNPEAKTDEEDEVITSEMITEAVDAEIWQMQLKLRQKMLQMK